MMNPYLTKDGSFAGRVGDLDIICLAQDRSFALVGATDSKTRQAVDVIVLPYDVPDLIAVLLALQAYMAEGTGRESG